MTVDLGAINWLAVIVATVVYFGLGAVWFAPQLPTGRAWMSASGYQSQASGGPSSSLLYLVPAATTFVAVVATAIVARATGTDTVGEGVLLGLVLAIGYAVTIMITTAAFEFRKPRQWTWGVINAGYHGVGLLVSAIILSLLR